MSFIYIFSVEPADVISVVFVIINNMAASVNELCRITFRVKS